VRVQRQRAWRQQEESSSVLCGASGRGQQVRVTLKRTGDLRWWVTIVNSATCQQHDWPRQGGSNSNALWGGVKIT
jgi:hypothetical protein